MGIDIELNKFELDHKDEKDDSYDEDSGFQVPPKDIISFNELRSCADLYRMYDTKQLEIDPDFQRDKVWSKAASTRFIDSLMKQLPIPSMCISLDYKTNKRLVIDGLQRMWSIIQFLDDSNWKLSDLEDIDPKISGLRVEDIQNKYPSLYSVVENVTIPVTVIRCDYDKKDHMEYLFTIFHRLNSGGYKLSNQEIRNCIYSGVLNNSIKLVEGKDLYRNLLGLEEGKTYRFAYQELVLRVYAFADKYKEYKGNLSKFLNEYMDDYQDDVEMAESKAKLFLRTVKLVSERVADGKTFSRLSKSAIEAILVGAMVNVEMLENESSDKTKRRFIELLKTNEFSAESLKNALTSRSKQIARIEQSVLIFSKP
tara:strand:+ start:130256 stop:131359 length:1104 start_codon:yes stop_codon:yes gene_type:complete